MKKGRYWIFTLISALALVWVLLIQIQWMQDIRGMKEQLFAEKSAIVLARTTETIAADSLLSQQLDSGVGPEQRAKIDSVFRDYLKYYNFPVDFTFDVVQPPSTSVEQAVGIPSLDTVACYTESMEEHNASHSWTLTFSVPEREGYLKDELRVPMILSVLLVMVVLILFISTVRSLLQEKKIADQTASLMNNMTHEFKTPITNISLAGKMLLRESATASPEKVGQFTRVILEENERLNKQVDQVLSMSAIENTVLSPENEQVDLNLLVQDTLRRFLLQLESKGGKVVTELNAGTSVVSGDVLMLGNAIGNLIDNALKYANGQPEISISTLNEEAMVVLKISDNGIGIDKDFHDQVFENYFRVPTGDVHNVKGFGLGLAYVKKVVELHHGIIQLQSEPGKGTSFTIKLPTGEK
ncbi:MAG: HAMP domain-containing histidine kinase [Bacteroidia bacterium]|nr:HAMP domain-containing histidine kinase [Bacteroidia bacterium]